MLYLLAADAATAALISFSIGTAAAVAGVTTAAGAAGAAIRWVWKTFNAKEADVDAKIATAVDAKEQSLRAHFKVVIDGLIKERDNALAAEKKAKAEQKRDHEEFLRETLPELKATRETHREFIESEARNADLLATKLDQINDRDEKLRLTLRAVTAELKARRK